MAIPQLKMPKNLNSIQLLMWINLKFLKLYQYLKLFKKTTFQSRKRSKGPLKATATTTLLEKQNDNLIIKAQQKALLQKLLKQRLG